MKQMTCAQMGGPENCDAMIKGNSSEEMIENGMGHVHKEHPKMAKDMETMPKEAGDKWMAEFKKKWDAAPEM